MGSLARWCLVFAACATPAFAKNDKPSQTYVVTALDGAAQPVLVVKGKEDLKHLGAAIKTALSKVEAYLKEKKITAAGAPLTRTLMFKQNFLEFESGFPVPKGTKGEGDVYLIELPAGKVAKTVHNGTPQLSHEAYEALHSWMRANKKRSAGQPWEVYVGPSNLEVYYPVKDKK